MDEKELAARQAELVRMFSAFSDKPDADRLRVYVEETASYPFPVFQKAVRSALQNQQREWAPSVGKIRSCAGAFLREYRDEQDELRLQAGRRPRLLK